MFQNFLNLYPITKMSCFIKLYFITIMYFMYFIVEDNDFHSRNVCNMCLHVREADSFVMMADGVSPDISEYSEESNQPNAAVYASCPFLSDFFSHPILSFPVFHQIHIFCLCHLYNNRIFSLTHVTYLLSHTSLL